MQSWLVDDFAFSFQDGAMTPPPSSWPEILGVGRHAGIDEVKAAYRGALKAHHPDLLERFGPKLRAVAEEETRRITAAYAQARAELGF